MKINHDADKVQDVFPDHELDEKKLQELWEQIQKSPESVLGKKKSETAEYLSSIAEDPEALLVISMCLIKGLVAVHTLERLKDATEVQMSQMDLSDMPKDLAEKILADDAAPEELKERIRIEAKCMTEKPKTEDVADEFERLRRKYQ